MKSRSFYLPGEPIYHPSGVAEDDGLCDGKSFIQIAECVKFPLLLLHVNVKLPNTFNVSDSFFTRILIGSRMKLVVIYETSVGIVADSKTI